MAAATCARCKRKSMEFLEASGGQPVPLDQYQGPRWRRSSHMGKTEAIMLCAACFKEFVWTVPLPPSREVAK